MLLVAALVGQVLARRTLGPVARASEAARLIAAGRLDTRLPVGAADEFGAWAAAFNEMADALETKIAALSAAQARELRFTANVAHELRTPLTALVAEAPADPGDTGSVTVSPQERIKPLVGTPVPAVTRTGPSPGTWLTEVPRTWRTASAMPFMPWM